VGAAVCTTLLVVDAVCFDPDFADACAAVLRPNPAMAANTPVSAARVQRSLRVRAGTAARRFWMIRIISLQPEEEAAGK
jgi:hypothetical protein